MASTVVMTSSESVVWMVRHSPKVLSVGSSVAVIVVVPETVSLAVAIGESALEAWVGGEETPQDFVAVSLLVRTLPEGKRCLTREWPRTLENGQYRCANAEQSQHNGECHGFDPQSGPLPALVVNEGGYENPIGHGIHFVSRSPGRVVRNSTS